MINERSSVRPAIIITASSVLCFINGLWVIFAGTSYFSQLSPYYLIFQTIYRLAPLRSVNIVRYFLFSSGMQFILAPVLGVLFGAGIGWVASRFDEELATPFIVKICAIAGGIAGFISLAIVFLNVYAN